MKHILLLSALAVFNLHAADERKPAVDSKPAADAKPAADTKTTDLTAGGLTFKAASPWVAKKEARRMSAGGFTIPGKDGAAGVEADIYHFGGPGGGGDNETNIQRWQKQFVPDEDGNLPEGKRSEVEVAGKKLIFVTFKGTFLGGSVMDENRPKLPGYTMTGVIIPTEDGSIYFKISGPDAAMTAAADQIKGLVTSAFPAAK
jgi:hypothetical protein